MKNDQRIEMLSLEHRLRRVARELARSTEKVCVVRTKEARALATRLDKGRQAGDATLLASARAALKELEVFSVEQRRTEKYQRELTALASTLGDEPPIVLTEKEMPVRFQDADLGDLLSAGIVEATGETRGDGQFVYERVAGLTDEEANHRYLAFLRCRPRYYDYYEADGEADDPAE